MDAHTSTADVKAEIYRNVAKEIAAVLDGETCATAKMATISCMLSHAFDHFFWTGFYVVDPDKKDELVVGPYQGTLGCLRIPFGRGVCGEAAVQAKTIIVDNVHEHPGHIACDSRSNSEIVVPVFDSSQNLIAVLDVDSTAFGAFDQTDANELEVLLRQVFAG